MKMPNSLFVVSVVLLVFGVWLAQGQSMGQVENANLSDAKHDENGKFGSTCCSPSMIFSDRPAAGKECPIIDCVYPSPCFNNCRRDTECPGPTGKCCCSPCGSKCIQGLGTSG